MQSTMQSMQLRSSVLRQTVLRSRAARPTPRCVVSVRAEKKDSYQKIEEPVRGGEGAPGEIPDGGPPVSERKSDLDKQITAAGGDDILGSPVSLTDAMRFNGAAPEIINGRLAMVGFVAAVFAEIGGGAPVAEQLGIAPLSIGLVFALFTVASLVPILRGEPRKGGEYWGGVPQFTPDAELINGRVAMLGFAGLLFVEAIKGRAVF